MQVNCSKCGGPIGRQLGPGGRRKMCATCSPPRVRRDRPRKRPVAPLPPLSSVPIGTDGEVIDMTSATRVELARLGADQGHVLSLLALLLAHHIDHADGVSAAGLIAMLKELAAIMADIRARCG